MPGGDQEIEEPENSTVDDWFGQNVARDQDVADQAMADAGGDEAKAEQLYEQRASGEETYEEGRSNSSRDAKRSGGPAVGHRRHSSVR